MFGSLLRRRAYRTESQGARFGVRLACEDADFGYQVQVYECLIGRNGARFALGPMSGTSRRFSNPPWAVSRPGAGRQLIICNMQEPRNLPKWPHSTCGFSNLQRTIFKVGTFTCGANSDHNAGVISYCVCPVSQSGHL